MTQQQFKGQEHGPIDWPVTGKLPQADWKRNQARRSFWFKWWAEQLAIFGIVCLVETPFIWLFDLNPQPVRFVFLITGIILAYGAVRYYQRKTGGGDL